MFLVDIGFRARKSQFIMDDIMLVQVYFIHVDGAVDVCELATAVILARRGTYITQRSQHSLSTTTRFTQTLALQLLHRLTQF